MTARIPAPAEAAPRVPGGRLLLGLPRAAVALAVMLGSVGLVAASYVAMVPFDTHDDFWPWMTHSSPSL